MTIEDKLVPSNFEKGRQGETPLLIVIHTMVGTLEGTYAWFKNPTSKVSSHYGIGLDGRIWKFVKEEDTAWHAGTKYNPTSKIVNEKGGNPNYYSIGIEHEDNGQPEQERTENMYEASAHVVFDIAKRWNIPLDREHVIGHKEIRANKTCPGALSVEKILAKAKEVAMNGTLPTLDWAVKLESFFLERNIPPERRESEVRRWADANKILDGFISKWKVELNLTEDCGLAQIEEHFSKLMGTEDDYVALREAAEAMVGKFDDDKALRLALTASGGDLKQCVARRNHLEEENKTLKSKRTLDKFKDVELLKELLKRRQKKIKQLLTRG